MSSTTHSPPVSKQQDLLVSRSSISSNYSNNDDGDIFKRGQAFLQAKALKISQMEEEKNMREQKDLKFKPSISRKAQEMSAEGIRPHSVAASGHSYYSYSKQWKQKVDAHLQLKKEQLEREEEKKLKANKTGLNKKSKYIIQKNLKQKKYRNPIEGWNERFEQFQKHRMDNSKLQDEFKPHINKKSVALKRKGSIYSRLHQEARKKEKKLLSQREQKRAQELYDTNTGQPLFRPQINDKSNDRTSIRSSGIVAVRGSPNNNDPVYDQLHSKAALLQKKKTEMANRTPPNTTFKPKLDKKSLEIASNLYNRKPLYSPQHRDDSSSAPSRSNAGKSSYPSSTLKSSAQLHNSSSHSLHGEKRSRSHHGALPDELNFSSRSLLNTSQESTDGAQYSGQSSRDASAQIEEFLQRRKHHEQLKQERLRQLQERKHSEELKECTFQPSLNEKSRKMMDRHMRNKRHERRERLRDLKESFGLRSHDDRGINSFHSHYAHDYHSDASTDNFSDETEEVPSHHHQPHSPSHDHFLRERSPHYQQWSSHRNTAENSEQNDRYHDTAARGSRVSAAHKSPNYSDARYAANSNVGLHGVDDYVDRVVKDAWRNVVENSSRAPSSPQLTASYLSSDDEEPRFHNEARRGEASSRRRRQHTSHELHQNKDDVLDSIQSDLDSALSDWNSLMHQGVGANL